jgi:small neutral amino acid transporter SnatA (MarC family)
VAVFPLTIPLMAAPGALATILLLSGNAHSIEQLFVLILLL